jgi:hypothetical protein
MYVELPEDGPVWLKYIAHEHRMYRVFREQADWTLTHTSH